MSNRYSIDAQGYEESSEGEEDLVYSEGQGVSDHDRDLLRADKEVLKALSQKGRSSPKIKSFLPKPKRKVKFGGEYQQLGKTSEEGTGSSKGGGSGGGRRFESMRYGDEEDEFSDNSDIEIDVPRRRRRNKNAGRRLHILLAVLLLLAGFLFVSHFMDPKEDKKSSNNAPKHRPDQKKILNNGTHDFYPSTIIVSLDGFHPHYVNKDLTPNLHDLYTNHASAPYMIPSFPSSTFPNHWSLVTGLYPSNHGIVGNTFYDPILKKQFFNTKPGQSLQLEWWGGEPIWQTAAGQHVKTAVHMWPGSEAPWEKGAPIEVDKYNGTEKLDRKANSVLKWLDRGDLDKRPELMLTYVPTVDSVGHKYGISGPELKKALKDVDEFVGYFQKGLKERHLDDIVNLVIVSDHGMAPTSNDRIVYLEDLVDLDKIDHVDGWPLVGLRPKDPSDVKPMYDAIKEHRQSNDSTAWDVYLHDEFPPEWHFGGSGGEYSHRIADLWLVPHVGWSITTRKQMQKMKGVYKPFGVHGYNNTEVLMRALFTATGPYFKEHRKYEPFENVNVYHILCDTLGIEPASHDGHESISKTLSPLPDDWVDTVSYPDVAFDTEILKIDSTYDALYSQHLKNATNQHGVSTHAMKEPETNTNEPQDGPLDLDDDNDDKQEGWIDWFKGHWDSVKSWVSSKIHNNDN